MIYDVQMQWRTTDGKEYEIRPDGDAYMVVITEQDETCEYMYTACRGSKTECEAYVYAYLEVVD